jgi:hypothetical protein
VKHVTTNKEPQIVFLFKALQTDGTCGLGHGANLSLYKDITVDPQRGKPD